MIWTQDPWGWWSVQDGGKRYSVNERGTACTCLSFNASPFRESDCPHLVEFRHRQGEKPIKLISGSVAASAATRKMLARMKEAAP